MFFEDFLTFLIKWFQSRRWSTILFLGSWVVGLPFMLLCTVIWGATLSKQTVASRYLDLVNGDVEQRISELNQEEASQEGTGEEIQPLIANDLLVPFRRLLQLGNFNERIVYLVARQFERQGRVAAATRLLRNIAPTGSQGFAPAHAWLAGNALNEWTGTREQADLVLNDFQHADMDLLGLKQIAVYAKLLSETGKKEQAKKLLESEARRFPELYLPLAELAKESGSERELRLAVRAGREAMEERIVNGKTSASEILLLVRLAMLEDKIDNALAIATTGAKNFPNDIQFRQVLASVLVAKYRKTTRDGTAESDGLQFLDAALRADPTNSTVIEAVAEVASTGKPLTAELESALEKSLADGTASALTHLIRANSKLIAGDYESALPHLELANRKAPNSPIILNNLAFTLIKSAPDRLQEAAQFVETARRIPNVPPGPLASIYDTQGDIRMLQNDVLGAIESYETAIKYQSDKLSTRRSLIAAYEKAGMTDLAELQRNRIQELSKDE